jgi:hypothetical protein
MQFKIRTPRPCASLRFVLLILLGAACVCGASGQAVDPCVDGNNISLPSRPNLANSADTTQCGLVELEYGWTRQWPGAGDKEDAFNSAVRMGLRNNLDIRWSADDLLHSSGGGHSATGIGDVALSVRYRISKQTRKLPAFATMYTVKFPTASERQNLGSGYADHSIALIASKDFGANRLDFNVIGTFLGAPRAFGHSGILALAYSRPLTKRLTGIAEFSGSIFPEGSAIGTWALNYRVGPLLTLDSGMDIGITRGLPRKRLMVGMTYALGRLFRGVTRAASGTAVE